MIAKLELWAGCVLAVLAGLAVAIFEGYRSGKAHASAKVQKAKQRAADAQETTRAYKTRQKVDEDVQSTPEAGPQKVNDADADTAAGHLRDDGWLRDNRER